MSGYTTQYDKNVISNAVTKAICNNVTDTIVDIDIHWQHAFGVYVMVFSALHGAAESIMVELKGIIKPSLHDWQRAEEWAARQKRPQNCKMKPRQWRMRKIGECLRNGWSEGETVLVNPYPWYRGEVSHAIEQLNDNFFEQWAQQECKENDNIVNNLVDINSDFLKFDTNQIRYTVQNNMNRQFIDDAKIKSLVYTCRLLYQLIEDYHNLTIWMGPIMPGDKDEAEIKSMDIKGPNQSPAYSKAWEQRMRSALPITNIKAIDLLYEHFCQGWEHDDKSIEYGIRAIIRKAADEDRLKNFDMEPVLNESGFDRELNLINLLDCYNGGMFPVNIAILQTIREHINGMRLEDLDKFVCTTQRGMTNQLRVRYLATAAICKGMYDGDYDPDTFNDYMRQCMSIKPEPRFKSSYERMCFNTACFTSCYSALLSAPGTVNPRVLPPAIAKFLTERTKNDEDVQHYIDERDKAVSLMIELSKARQRVEAQRQQRVEAAPSPEPTPQTPPLHTPLALEIDPGSPRKHSNHWTVEEREYLLNHYKDSMESIQQHIGRTAHAIRNKIYRMGLSKKQ